MHPSSPLLNPPWIELPGIPWGSLGWRMGSGEDFWKSWINFYKSLTANEQATYQARWPEESGWVGFYAFIEHGIEPPWATERRKKFEEPQLPPAEGESEIVDYYRIVWLLRNHLKREPFPYRINSDAKRQKEDEYLVEFYAAPGGSLWRLGYLSAGGLRLGSVQSGA